MIEYKAEDWVRVILRLKGSVLPRLLVRIAAAAAAGAVALAMHRWTGFAIGTTLHALIAVALGLLLVFRTNASYERFWEGRKLVGELVNGARDLMRQIVTQVDDKQGDRAEIRRLIVAYYYVSLQSLRDEDDLPSLSRMLREPEMEVLADVTHRSAIILTWISHRVMRLVAHDDTSIVELRLNRLDLCVRQMNSALAGCQRIRRTPVPFAYAQHIKVFLALFCYTAPFAMVGGMVWWTPVAAAVLALALFGIDEIGVEIEDPFGTDPNDLPLDDIGKSLDTVTREMLAASFRLDDDAVTRELRVNEGSR